MYRTCMRECPVTEKTTLTILVCDRGLVPTLQNRVYDTREAALAAPFGELEVLFSEESQFGFNSAFDPAAIKYDRDYDNTVSSASFIRYYEELADYLYKRYDLAGRTVIDVGCGKGTFLKTLVRMKPDVRGIGIDPAFVDDGSDINERLHFICDVFRENHIAERPGLLLSRHTLEHIHRPVDFLRCIFAPLSTMAEVPVFVEVPDFSWIVHKHTFWDFCYEHCNYFTARSIARALQNAGATIQRVQSAFGNQYLWAEAVLNLGKAVPLAALPTLRAQEVTSYVSETESNIESVASQLIDRQVEREVVIWGMATKGVVYSGILAKHGFRANHFVDQNRAKQERYTPMTGFRIAAPTSLEPGVPYAVICMNPNYADEIKRFCCERKLNTVFLAPDLSEC